MNLASIRKTITALVTGALGWGAMVVASDPAAVTASEWLMGGVVLATALGVYGTPNAPTAADVEKVQAVVATAAASARNEALADVSSLHLFAQPKPPAAKRPPRKAVK